MRVIKSSDLSAFNLTIARTPKPDARTVPLLCTLPGTREPFYIQTPPLYVPFSPTRYKDEEHKRCVYAFECSLIALCEPLSASYSPSLRLLEFIRDVETKAIKALSPCLQQSFKSCIREPKDSRFAPCIRMRAIVSKSTKTQVYAHGGAEVRTLHDIRAGVSMRVILHVPYIWVSATCYGICVCLTQASITSEKRRVFPLACDASQSCDNSFQFIDEDASGDTDTALMGLIEDLTDDF